jgi:hypothetical protein
MASHSARAAWPWRVALLAVVLLLSGCGASMAGPTAQATATLEPTAIPRPTATPQPPQQPIQVRLPPNCMPVATGAFPFGTYTASQVDMEHSSMQTITFQANGELHHDTGLVTLYLGEGRASSCVARQVELTRVRSARPCSSEDRRAAFPVSPNNCGGVTARIMQGRDGQGRGTSTERAKESEGGTNAWTLRSSRTCTNP